MKIYIKPSDIVRRSLWRKYVDYVLINSTEEQLKNILLEDVEFEINEEDALVMDLLKVIETPNLCYKLNKLLIDFLNQRSIKNNLDTKYYVNKKGLLKLINTFEKNFPDYFKTTDKEYLEGINHVKKYSKELIKKIDKVEPTIIKINEISMECVPINTVKKMINMFI